jgi:hypothetical protein
VQGGATEQSRTLHTGSAARKLLWRPGTIVSSDEFRLSVCVGGAGKRSRNDTLNESILRSIVVVEAEQRWMSDDSLFTAFEAPRRSNAYATVL